MEIKRFIFFSFLLSGSILLGQSSVPKTEVTTRILFVFDGSQSMYGRWESGTKIDVAQRLIGQLLDSLQSLEDENLEVGLRVYGHQRPVPPQDCNDTRLEVPLGSNTYQRIKNRLKTIKPKGTTPIARSILRSANDFSECSNCRNILILLTDGVEACDEDPCAASEMLQKKGVILKPFVIGIGNLKELKESLDCVGNYFDAADEKTFKNILNVVVAQVLDNTTAELRLLDYNQKPTETDVAVSLFNATSNLLEKQFVHTLNYRGNPDTLYLDPLVTYNLIVHSIPEVILDSAHIEAGKHNQLDVNMPRGTLAFNMEGRNNYTDLTCVVGDAESRKTIHVQAFGEKQKYLAGTYQLELLTLPRIRKQVSVEGGKTTVLEVAPPGRITFTSTMEGYGSILLKTKTGYQWVIDLQENTTTQSFTLQPGDYRVVFRAKAAQSSEYSITKEFSITSGKGSLINLN